MPDSVDKRDFGYIRKFNLKDAEKKSQKKLSKTHQVSIKRTNDFIGGAERVQSTYTSQGTQYLSNVERHELKANNKLSDATIIGIALKHLQNIKSTLGFQPSENPEFVPDPRVKRPNTEELVVNVQQYYRGIPVFQMERVIVLNKLGAIKYVDGSSVSLPFDLDIQPVVKLEEAALRAAEHIGLPDRVANSPAPEPQPSRIASYSGKYNPKVICTFQSTAQRSVLDKDSFGEVIPAHLVFFYTGKDVRLGWHLTISTSDLMDQYDVIIAADVKIKGEPLEVLYSESAVDSMSAARGLVWTHNPAANSGVRKMQVFPQPLDEHAIQPLVVVPDGFPLPWIHDTDDVTDGNNILAGDGLLVIPVRGVRQDGVLTFEPAEDHGNEQRVINAFYFCNFMHDFFFMLGFDESMNLQRRNTTATGIADDPLVARIIDSDDNRLGTTHTSVDGRKTNMSLFIGTSPPGEPVRHSALDAEVVFHEFTHAVTRRAVGRSLNTNPLRRPQSKALAEGWSDYFALTILNCYFDLDLTKIMTWVSHSETGVRRPPYDDDFPRNIGVPDGDQGGAFAKINSFHFTEPHEIGKIWCATLMKMNRELITVFGDKTMGHRIGWQLVFNGLLKLSANPSFIQARDEIIGTIARLSLADDKKDEVRRAVLKSFAFFGLGPNASSNGASLSNIVGDTGCAAELTPLNS